MCTYCVRTAARGGDGVWRAFVGAAMLARRGFLCAWLTRKAAPPPRARRNLLRLREQGGARAAAGEALVSGAGPSTAGGAGEMDSDSDDSDSDDDDDDAALLAELERIKAERAEEAARAEAEAKAEEEAAKGAMFSAGNPLLAGAGGGGVKRRWDDDVVFRNQAREEPKKRTGFINDTIRNDFHKRFISRYIR